MIYSNYTKKRLKLILLVKSNRLKIIIQQSRSSYYSRQLRKIKAKKIRCEQILEYTCHLQMQQINNSFEKNKGCPNTSTQSGTGQLCYARVYLP